MNIFESLKVSKSKVVVFSFSLYAFFLSMGILPFAMYGDQEHYIKFYNALAGLSFLEGYTAQQDLLGTSEPGYFLFTYISAIWLNLDRVLLFSILNTVLAYVVINWIVKNNVSTLVVFLLSVNFYLLILFFSSERLKLATIFFVLYLSCSGRYKFVFLAGSIFTHVQLIVFLISGFILNFISSISSLTRLKYNKRMVYLLFVIIFGIAVLVVLQEHLVNKMGVYINQLGIVGVSKVFLFLLMTLYYAWSKRTEIIALFFPILILAFLFGGERLVIFGYFIFMYYGLQSHRGLNLGVVVTSFYFAVKGVLFLYDVVVYGDGFYN